jgi:hypothetical protein
MPDPDPQQDWLTSSDNHASRDYERERRRETWSEAHPPAGRRTTRRRKQRKRNRAASRFGAINWDAYSHRELYDMVNRANLVTMYGRAREWSELAGRIEGTTGRVQQVLQRLMTSWQGQAAVDAAAANTRLMQWAGTASHTAGRIAEGLANYTEAVEVAQRRMPEPGFASAERNFRDGYTVTMTGGPSDAVFLRELLTDGMVSHEQARARKAEAVAVMSGYESDSRQVHDSLPQFTDAQTGIEPGPSWTPDPAVDDGAGSSGSSSAPPGVDVPGATVSGGTTSAAGFVDPSPAGKGGSAGTGYGGGPGSLNGAFGGGAGAGADGGTVGNRGGAGIGAGGMLGRGVPGAGGAVAGPGARGGAGAFGGVPFGAGTGGEEDAEHTNKYDEGLDLFDDLPPAYPPVFGA